MTRVVLVFGSLLFFAATALAQKQLPPPQFLADSGVEMRITSYYEQMPPGGFLPLRIVMRNGSSAAHQWQVRVRHFQNSDFQVTSNISVPANSEKTFEILAPLAPQPRDKSRYSSLNIQITGHAVENGFSSESVSISGKDLTCFVGMGKELSVSNWGKIAESLDKSARSLKLDGTPLDPGMLPSDWRGLAGFDVLFFTATEWRAIPAAQKEAVMEWVSQGGNLYFCYASQSAVTDLPAVGPEGFGNIGSVTIDDALIPAMAAVIASHNPLSAADQAMKQYGSSWKLAENLGQVAPPTALILSFVLLFAVFIGPVNFFIIAGEGNRHRLFWSVPLISLIASLIMVGYIFLREGFGGQGSRYELIYSLPSANRTILAQEQISRTGVLWNNTFTPPDSALMIPVSLQYPGEMNGRSFPERGFKYELQDGEWSGDWFRSRSSQAQLLLAVVSSRSRVEITAAGAAEPTATSSFERDLAPFYYKDESGSLWTVPLLRAGERVTLQRADEMAWTEFQKQALLGAGPHTEKKLRNLLSDRSTGKFFASMEGGMPIGTLPSIHWEANNATVVGEVLSQ